MIVNTKLLKNEKVIVMLNKPVLLFNGQNYISNEFKAHDMI